MKNCRFKALFTYVPYIHLLYTVCYFTPSAGFCLKLRELLDQEVYKNRPFFLPFKLIVLGLNHAGLFLFCFSFNKKLFLVTPNTGFNFILFQCCLYPPTTKYRGFTLVIKPRYCDFYFILFFRNYEIYTCWSLYEVHHANTVWTPFFCLQNDLHFS